MLARPENPARCKSKERWIERLPIAGDQPGLATVATLAMVLAAWLLRTLANPALPAGFPYVTFFPAVIITSFLFGVRQGLLSATLCGLLAWYFFIPPGGSLMLTNGAGFALAFYVLVVGTDLALVHWMQVANRHLAEEREISRALAEMRELLFRELQHRVSNNLQVAAALLAMQKRQLASDEARDALDASARRLDLIGRISRQLYDPAGAAQALLPFLDELCRSVIEASGRSDITLRLRGDETLRLEPDAAIPAALIVAEALTNAIEHGFAGDRAGAIDVEVGQAGQNAEGGVRICVRDDGHGLPTGFDVEAGTSLGLRIARMLAKGQNGVFEMRAERGTVALLTLPAGRR